MEPKTPIEPEFANSNETVAIVATVLGSLAVVLIIFAIVCCTQNLKHKKPVE